MALMRPRVFGKEENQAVSPVDLPVTAFDPVGLASPAESYRPEAPAEYRDELPVLGVPEQIEVTSGPFISMSIRIPQDIYDEYKRVAVAQDLTVEEVIQHRLEACRSHNALRGLWFSDSERGQLENLIQKWPLESAAQALSIISRAASVKFDEIQISLTPAQKRVLSLSMFGGRTPKSFFEAMVKKELRV